MSGASGSSASSRSHDGRQRLVVDEDQLGRVLGDVAALGDDDGDRLADVAHLVLGQRHLRARVEDQVLDGRRRDQQRAGLPVVAQVGGSVDGHHAGHVRAPCDVSMPRDAGVGVVAAHEGGVQHARAD